MNQPYPADYQSWPRERQDAWYTDRLKGAGAQNSNNRNPQPLTAPVGPPAPYPIDALGDVLGGAAKVIARKVQCAESMAAQSVIAVASLGAQALADVRLPFGQTRPLSLFFLTIAASGDRKTSADREAMTPVRMREQQLRDAFEPLARGHAIAHAAWRAQKQQVERQKADIAKRQANLEALGPEPEAPIKPVLTLGEARLRAWLSICRCCRARWEYSAPRAVSFSMVTAFPSKRN